MKPRFRVNPFAPLFFTAALAVVGQTSFAATRVKVDNLDDLNLSTSWSSGVIPGPLDVATWDSTISGANSTILGGNLTWGGIAITNPGGAVTIGSGNTLTLGSSGINMSAATQNLTISSNLSLPAGSQTWNVAAGRTLTLNTGTFSRSAGSTLNIQGSGTVSAAMTGLANDASENSGLLGPWATIGTGASTAWATLSGGNVVAYTHLGGSTGGTIAGAATANTNWLMNAAGTVTYGASSRTLNTLRYASTGGTITMGNSASQINLVVNGILNAGTGTLTINPGGSNAASGIRIGGNNNRELVVNAANANIALGRIIDNAGGASSLTIAGSGSNTVTLTGVNTFTGATNVSSGTLVVGGTSSINSSSGVSILGGKYVHTSSVASTRTIALNQGTLDGTGSVGAVTVADNGAAIIANGNGGTTALTLSSLSFGGDATVNLNLGTGVGLNVTGALSTTPANGSVLLNATKAGWTLGSNNLIGFGSFGGFASDFTLGTITGLGARQSASGLAVSGSFLALNVTGDLPVWTGTNGSAWATATTGDNSGPNNWATKNALSSTNFWTADTPEFNDTYNLGAGAIAVANRTVDVQGANVSPGTVTFNNSAGDYTLSSTTGHGITGTASLVKSGSSKLVITNTNTFTGSTTINGGTLEIGDGTTDGSITSSSGITNNASLIYNLAGTQAYGNGISGTGSLTKDGAGTLTLSGNNTYQGGTTISAGTLTLSGSGSLGTGAISIDTGATLNLNKDYTTSVSVSGGGAIINTASHTVTGDYSGFTGSYTHNTTVASTAFNSAGATSENASYQINSVQGSSQGMIAAGSGNYTLKMGSLSGVANSLVRGGNVATGTTTLEIGNLNTSTTFAGSINNGATKTIALTKVGTGSLTLSGTSNYTGATLVSAGTLLVNGALGNTAVSVTGGTLGGSGSIAGTVSITGSGILAPGTSPESLATGALTMGSGSTFAFEAVDATATGADIVAVNGTLSLTGVTLDLSGADLDGGFWSLGDKLTLLSYIDGGSGITGGFTGFTDGTTYVFGGNQWIFDYNDISAGGNFTADAAASGQNYFVTMTIVPEPGAALLGGIGVLALLRRRRD